MGMGAIAVYIYSLNYFPYFVLVRLFAYQYSNIPESLLRWRCYTHVHVPLKVFS